jgi:hypothetical protein
MKKVKKAKAKQKKPKTVTWVHTDATIYWMLASVKRVDEEAQYYADSDSIVEAWIRAKRKPAATAFAKRSLAADGWQIKEIQSLQKVAVSLARLGSMVDPPIFSEEEADEWAEQYRIAETDGFSYTTGHWLKRKPRSR